MSVVVIIITTIISDSKREMGLVACCVDRAWLDCGSGTVHKEEEWRTSLYETDNTDFEGWKELCSSNYSKNQLLEARKITLHSET